MAVRNAFRAAAANKKPLGNFPSRNPRAPNLPNPEHNPDAKSPRGRRRSNRTEEYKSNCKTRRSQSYPRCPGTHGQQGRGPLKGPSKRESAMGREDWCKIMNGEEKKK